MPLHLSWLGTTSLPVEAVALNPESFASRSAVDVARVSLPVGNATAEVGELFRVEGDGADRQLVIDGDLSHLRGLGQGLASGSVVVRGTVGPRLAAGMTGGTVEVEGDVAGWAGAEMRGGVLRIRGRA